MAIDGAEQVQEEEASTKPGKRQLKPLKRSAAAAAAAAAADAASTRRPALAQKRANTFTNTRAATTLNKATGKTTPQAVRAARRRREAAEAKHLAALAELEEAKRQEEEEMEQHRSKKLKTSEPEMMQLKGEGDVEHEDEEGGDEEEDQLAEEEERRVNSKYEAEVEGQGVAAKDEGWEDLDAGDEEDPLMVSTYVVEVYDYLRELEVRFSLAFSTCLALNQPRCRRCSCRSAHDNART